jgi:alkanesulfonate monooxygenase SsuD/methylene tetrahydromethanopterin reductase-like flavin-dependent oxidoreductase (luciferase family)
MKFGLLFHAQDPPDGQNIQGRWQDILESAKLAEDVGFDGVFLPEHHMMPDGYVPSPLIGLAAIASITKRIELGTTVLLLPFYNPVQVAEHAAMVNIISQGRALHLGVGIANFEPEFAFFGREKKNQAKLFEESVDLVRRLWTGEHVSHHTEFFDVEGNLTPVPPSADVWMGAMSFPGVKRAARMGAPWPADPLHNVHVIKQWADAYREAGQEYGTTEKLSIKLLRDGWVADDLEQAERDWWPSVAAQHWFYFEKVPRWVLDLEPNLQGVEKQEDFTFAKHHQERLVVGSPDQCVETLRNFESELGNDWTIMSFRLAPGPDHEKEMACIERFGKEVITKYRSAS